jgi:putative peptidoglycan lipid II flippase
MANGVRQIFLMLIPAAACTIALATPIVRLVYQRGEFSAHSTSQVATALFWFSFSLPFAGANLMLTRTFFSLQRPWVPTTLATLNMVVDAAVSVALYKPFGIAGLVIGTAVSSLGMTLGQAYALRRLLSGSIEGRRTAVAIAQMTAAAAALGAAAYGVWWLADRALGRSLPAQIVSVGAGLAAGIAVYVAAVLALRIPEAHQIRALVTRRRRARPA